MRGILTPLVCTLVLAVGCSSPGGPAADESPPASGPSADSGEAAISEETDRAIAGLRRMSEFLASQPGLRFEAEISYDAIQASGQKIEFGSHRTITLRRPDAAQIVVSHWDGARELLTFDGVRLSAAIPGRGVYASIEFVGNVAQALDHLVTEYGMAAPLADLLRRDLSDEVASRMRSARRVGSVTIAGELCDHLAFRGERVDFQIFIRQGDEPVPLRFLIDYHAETGGPQFRARLHDWELGPELPDSLFQLRPPSGTQHVEFAELLDLLLGSLDTREDDR